MTRPHLLRILTPTALALALLASLGCSKKPVAASANPFPESNQVQGWTRADEIRTFPAAELWKYIDGDAEKYLKAGVESASTSDYKFQDKFEAVVDIYTMSSPPAPRPFSTRSPPKAHPLRQLVTLPGSMSRVLSFARENFWFALSRTRVHRS